MDGEIATRGALDADLVLEERGASVRKADDARVVQAVHITQGHSGEAAAHSHCHIADRLHRGITHAEVRRPGGGHIEEFRPYSVGEAPSGGTIHVVHGPREIDGAEALQHRYLVGRTRTVVLQARLANTLADAATVRARQYMVAAEHQSPPVPGWRAPVSEAAKGTGRHDEVVGETDVPPEAGLNRKVWASVSMVPVTMTSTGRSSTVAARTPIASTSNDFAWSGEIAWAT